MTIKLIDKLVTLAVVGFLIVWEWAFHKPQQSVFMGVMQCDKCGQLIEFSELKSGELADCSACGNRFWLHSPNEKSGMTVETLEKTLFTRRNVIGFAGLCLPFMCCCGCPIIAVIIDPPPSAAQLAKIEEQEALQAKITMEWKQEQELQQHQKELELAGEKESAFDALVRLADPDGTLVASTSLENHTMTFVMNNDWHLIPYQTRLQTAQNFWEGWAKVDRAESVDVSRIKLVDQNGNEVGGSRVFAGSLIWVQQNQILQIAFF